MNKHLLEIGAVSTGGLAALGHFCEMIQPILADLSYAAAIIVAAVTIWKKFRSKE